ncbi:MAG: M20/M25/M40 family metallo-hydrolase, partial [Conexivisphaerales archaeon]
MSRNSARLLELDRNWPVQPPDPKPLWMNPKEKLANINQQKEKVFAIIDSMRDEAISFFQDLIKIPSVNPSEAFEKELADFVASKMKNLGMEVRQIEPVKNRVSDWSLLKGSTSDRTLVFYSHLDTVPVGDINAWKYPPFDARIADGKIIGRGSKDCKLGIASSLMAIEAIQRAGIRLAGDAMVITCADEETGGQLGIAKMIETGWVRGDFCIYGEGVPDR